MPRPEAGSRTRFAPGAVAPNFTLPDQNGKAVSLSDFLGRRLVVYFYPKDDTPGCTAEACQFNAALSQFVGLRVDVVGISADDAGSHRAFRQRYGLGFSLLSDAAHEVSDLYGTWGANTRPDGVEYVGMIRSTFLIDPTGRIERSWYNVRPDGHALEVWSAVQSGGR